MLRPGGYAVISQPNPSRAYFDGLRCEQLPSGTIERDTFACCHCGRIVHVKPLAPMDEFGSMCRNCMKMTCPKCADGPCVPFEKKLEQQEHRERALRSYGI